MDSFSNVVVRLSDAAVQNFVVYRISATLQLLFFFFCAVFLLPPRHFYIKNGIHALDTVSSHS